jgi:hypothetical protein
MTAGASGASRAEPEIIAEGGDWRAFKSDTSCMIGTGSSAGIALLYFVQQDAFALDVTSSIPWRFSGGADPAIRIQSDGQLVLSRDDGATKDNVLQFVLSREEVKVLLAKVSDGTRLQVLFPNGNKKNGFVNLIGSRPVVSAFSRCLGEKRTGVDSDDSLSSPPTETFSMTFDEFRKALDGKIRVDTLDKSRPDFSTTNNCQRIKESYTCDFHDAGFQSTVTNFKKMDILNGRFALKLKLGINTADGKLSRITLSGDRGDPVNLLQFVGTVENIMQTFDPKAGQEEGESKKIADELGFMRGDSADDIGTPRTAIKPYAEIRCLTQRSSITTHVECRFVPRS